MNVVSTMRRGARRMGATAFITCAALVLGIFAFLDEGVPVADVELHDGAVWLTNRSTLMVGHLNFQSAVLDTGLRTSTGQFDVLQSGNHIAIHDLANNVLSAVDPATVASVTDIALPRGSMVASGGGTVAVLDPSTGEVWATHMGRLEGWSLDEVPPLAATGADATLAVAADGTVTVISMSEQTLTTLRLDEAGVMEGSETADLELSQDSRATVTAVGSTPVALDSGSGSLIVGGRTIALTDDPISVVQQPSGDSSFVAVATSESLILQPLDGAEATAIPIDGMGIPAAPVYLNGCVYSAWAGAGVFVRDCVGTDHDLRVPIDGALPSAAFVFRVNRDVVVLNDYVNGTGWLVNDALERVDNWDDLMPPPADQQELIEFEDDEPLESLPDRDQPNTPPVAEDDSFGARAGRTTVLPVVDNDYDLDGDVLTVVVVDASGVAGDVQVIRGGAALQIVVPESATGRSSFTYRASDGRGGVDDATVTVEVVPEGSNAAPEQRRRSRVSVEAGAKVSYNVVTDWLDPDGDLLFLKDVGQSGPDNIQFTPDGVITITANADSFGTREIPVVISDGRDEVSGVLRLDVWPPGTQAPKTHPDHVVTTAGQTVVVRPLANDLSRSGLPLTLAKVSEVRGAAVVMNAEQGTFTFASPTAGTFYVQYLVTDGPNTATNLVRVDVLAEVSSSLPPIAVADVALVAAGDSVLVDVLANDSDPSGSVLVVQNVEVPHQSGLTVAILEHRLLRITNLAGIQEPVTLTYTASNGTHSASAEVTVLPINPQEQTLAPVAVDDEVVVRVGDIATVAVLDNDYHPSYAKFELAGLGAPHVDPAIAEVFQSENTLRIKAGDTATTVTASYDIIDEFGQRDSATLTIRIAGMQDTNSAPRPRDLEARVLATQSVRIPVPLDGIDPDGDSVTLLGLSSSPSQGRVVQVGQDWFIYEAYSDGRGTDTFTYAVRDRLGAEATGTVTVGVAPKIGINQPPIAVKDEVAMRPSSSISVPVLANDSDPDSDIISLEPEGLDVPDGIEATVVNGRVLVRSAREGEFTIAYTVSDVYGASTVGTLLVTVDPETPLVPPIARDDRVMESEVNDDGTVLVDVLANDEDPDGVTSELTISVDPLQGTVTPDKQVQLTLGEVAQVVTYTVTDPTGLSASAFILVPGLGQARPALLSAAPVEVLSGETKVFLLTDYVVTSTGNPALITEAERVFAAHGNGDSLVIDEGTLTYTSLDGYFGKDGLTFQVTDGLSLDDPLGTMATLTIPITVLPNGNQPPEFRDSSVQVAPGDDPVAVDLGKLATDPDPGDDELLEFALAGAVPTGFAVSVDTDQLLVSAGADVAKGTEIDVAVSVTDGKSTPVEGIVRVLVTASSRAMPVANDDFLDDLRPERTVDVDVLANDRNPFPDDPLVVVEAVVESGQGSAALSERGVAITPSAGFFGTLVVRYTIQDVTGDPDRRVSARIYATVVKEPDAPAKPTIKAVEDRRVTLEWVTPPSNGAPISHYTVQSDKGQTYDCTSNLCTLEGLTNDVEYRFTVSAHNRAGTSAPSPASDVARPDIRPDQPAPPTLQFGDRSLDVAWVTPSTAGSAVRSYTLEISPTPLGGSAQKTNVTGNVIRWEGLENGVAYRVRVQAHNDAVEPSTWSDYSATEIPAGPPAQIDKPQTERLEPVGNRAQLRVTWQVPSGNGDPVSSYTVTARRGGTVVTAVDVPAGETSRVFQLDTSTTDYTFTVVAHNKAGTSSPSVASDPRRAFTAPGASTSVIATPLDRSIEVNFETPPRNGADAAWIHYEYRLNGSGSWINLPANRIITGLTNGSTYTVQIRGVVNHDGVQYNGAASATSNSARPFGPIGNPSITGSSGDRQVTFTVTAPATNGRPIESIEYRTRVGSGSFSAWTLWSGFTSGSANRTVNGTADSQNITLEVRVKAEDTSGYGTASRTTATQTPPAPSVSVSRSSNKYIGGPCINGDYNCYNLVVVLDNFPANTSVSINCKYTRNGTVQNWTSTRTATTNGSGQLTWGPSQSSCFIGSENQNPWSGPFWAQIQVGGNTYDSNKNVRW
ncbi:MAG: hypothetical protein CVT64_03215 [Actinobacteria bacterium HGW-Actinobacteria-4]|nr:MAG: hypothetical protein CVT64_03215 [Actinobacteria bacterium HGW-Actinobacteria-4]